MMTHLHHRSRAPLARRETDPYLNIKHAPKCKCMLEEEDRVHLFSDYALNSSIHGVRYVGEKPRPWWERVFWLIIVAYSLYKCSAMINKEWQKLERSSVIVTPAEKLMTIGQIPFPAGEF